MDSKIELPKTPPDTMFKLLSKNVQTKKAVSFKGLDPIPEKKGTRLLRATIVTEEKKEDTKLCCTRCKNDMKVEDVILSCKNCYDDLEQNHYDEFLHVLSAVNEEIEKLKEENEHLLEKLRKGI